MASFTVVVQNNGKFYNYINHSNYKMGVKSDELINLFILSNKKLYIKIKIHTKYDVYQKIITIPKNQCIKVPILFKCENSEDFQFTIYLNSVKKKN